MKNQFTHSWETEYKKRGIPSSYRQEPTKVLIDFVAFLKQKSIQEKKALDLGAGRGRNAFYLAEEGYQITCFDLVQENILEINQKAKELHLPITAFCHDVTLPWPVQPHEFSVAIDIFCYKHIVNKELQKNYRKWLHSSLKDGGYYFLSLASDDDGFYGPLLNSSPDPSSKLIIDPFCHIASYLYSIDDITQEFSDTFQVVDVKKTTSFSPMHNKEYERRVLNFTLKKREVAFSS